MSATCNVCGARARIIDRGQPRCDPHHAAAIAEWKARRDAELATRERCSVAGCGKAATFDVAGVPLCGWCKRKALRGLYRNLSGAPISAAMCYVPTREEVVDAARA